MLASWEKLPDFIKSAAVKQYYDVLRQRIVQLVFKRIADIIFSAVLFVALLPIMLVCAAAVKLSSEGDVIFKQQRLTGYGRLFNVYKFRTMYATAEHDLPITTHNDDRVTAVGHFLRKTHLDELPQLWNILKGDMTFVGTRPEVPCFVDEYNAEWLATLLLPAGLTSWASVFFRNEAELINKAENAKEIYMNEILPLKMEMNLNYIKNFSLKNDVVIIFETIKAVLTDI
ncbi:MAG: sugar transferase [Oscillospiraceae bacterium]|nr:sugar transferase [Oscillospiraceae bacterium]